MRASDYIAMAAVCSEPVDMGERVTNPAPAGMRYMTLAEMRASDDDTVRAYVDHIRRVYHVNNAILAATNGVCRATVIEMLRNAGVPRLSTQEGMMMAKNFDRDAWARFVTAGMTDTDTDDTEPTTEPVISAHTRQTDISTRTVTITGVTPAQAAAAVHAIVSTDCPGRVIMDITVCREGDAI